MFQWMPNAHFVNLIKFCVAVNVLNVRTLESNFMNIVANADYQKVSQKHVVL